MEECGRFSPSTFMWIMELELQLRGLHTLFFLKATEPSCWPYLYIHLLKRFIFIVCIYVS